MSKLIRIAGRRPKLITHERPTGTLEQAIWKLEMSIRWMKAEHGDEVTKMALLGIASRVWPDT